MRGKRASKSSGRNFGEKLRSFTKHKNCSCEYTVKPFTFFPDSIRNGDNLRDMKIKNGCGHEKMAHSIMIFVLSDIIFEACVQSGSKDVFFDFSDKTVDSIVELAHTGNCTVSRDNLKDLLSAGKQYDIRLLLSLCGSFMLKDLEISNSVFYYKLATDNLCKHSAAKFAAFLKRNMSDLIQDDSAQVTSCNFTDPIY